MESSEERQAKSIRDTLLNLPGNELEERIRVRKDYIFYKGKSIDLGMAKHVPILYGQNWPVDDNCDYKPTQDIRNKIKPLLRKQARWMFGVRPTLKFKPDNKEDREKCEELRKFIEDVLDDNSFWPTTKKAFLESSVKKRVLLRVEANPNSPLVIKYESIENFYYKEKNGKLLYVVFFEEDEENVYKESDTEKFYYLHTYYYKFTEGGEKQAWYKKETYKNSDLQENMTIEVDTGFSTIPCWLIKNGGELNNSFGESDVEELMDIQNQYNRTVSDFRDALRFQMFGAEVVIDGNEDDVNKFTIAPGALHAVKTNNSASDNGKQAVVQRMEYTMGNNAAVEAYLERAEADMNFTMDMPKLKDLNNIPSAKAMGYLYNDLISRCEEKWNDWTPAFLGLFEFIKEVGEVCYLGKYDKSWNQLKYSTLFEHNYPLPSDDEAKKTLAMSEVDSGVRSHQSYIKDYSDTENAEDEWNEILKEKSQLTNSEDSFTEGLNSELNNGVDNNLNIGE
ncbi:MAG: phage portal protein [Clostridium sp.]|uniref:phage portal protein n=1 Tax=Clostridium sp. TaxID=1506 RepID=UPI0025C34062|nr:phage portal protein [Clostridium sp.]MCH3962983.1 phage portal protein [Clostridium sp.]MCI1800192.1 phage portal protein [Clostridium sp.]MCI2202062.1 phage portal protein [Clostridium sp.]